VQELVQALVGEERADLNVDFCAAIPMLTITGSFGVAVDDALALRASLRIGDGALSTFLQILAPIVADRRANPRDDLISILAHAELTDEDGVTHRLSDEEIYSFSHLLLAAGSGTTWKEMGILLATLLQRPELLAAARADRTLLRPVIDEIMRWCPTDPMFSRFALRDTTLAGVEIPARSVVHLCVAAANRDPSRWDDPDTFDPHRPLQPHLGFGSGPHVCLGMHVARAEMLTGVNALLDTFPDLRLDPDAPEPRVIGLYERGPSAVPVLLGKPAS
jgi:cytochrome P450